MQLQGLARLQCTLEEIAAGLGIARQTLYTRLREDEDLREALEAGRAEGRVSLRRRMYDRAMHEEKADGVLIHLSKHWLGMHDRVETTTQEIQAAPAWVQQLTPEELEDAERYLAGLAERADQRAEAAGADEPGGVHPLDDAALPGVMAPPGDLHGD